MVKERASRSANLGVGTAVYICIAFASCAGLEGARSVEFLCVAYTRLVHVLWVHL